MTTTSVNANSDDSSSTKYFAISSDAPNSDRQVAQLTSIGKFRLEAELGRGGMGVVYAAVEKSLDRKVALKLLPKSCLDQPISRQRFLIETRAAAHLNHDNIVPIYEVGEDAGAHFYTMKLVEGCDLAKVISRARCALATAKADTQATAEDHTVGAAKHVLEPSSSAVSECLSSKSFSKSLKRNGQRSAHKLAQTVAQIGAQIADALQHAHDRGIIHRDIKPSNILLDTTGKPWITDFGLAHLQNAPAITGTGEIVGTLRYMSPEQASGRRAFLDHRTDIYSLGVALYELATLQPACRGDGVREILRELTFERPLTIRRVNPRLPRDFETIISKAMERNPNDRYQTSREFADDLSRFYSNESITTKRTSKWRHLRDWLYERPLIAGTGVATAALLVICLCTILWLLSSKLTITNGLWHISEATAVLAKDKNAGQSLAHSIISANLTPGYAADRAILSALEMLHEQKTILIGDSGVGELAFSPNGKLLLKCVDSRYYSDRRATARVYDPDTGQPIKVLTYGWQITTGAFSPDGLYLVGAGSPHSLQANAEPSLTGVIDSPAVVWSTNDWKKEPLMLNGTRVSKLSSNCFSKTGSRVVLPSSVIGEVLVFNTSDWTTPATPLKTQSTANILSAIISPDAKWIATWSEDGELVLWDAVGGNVRYSWKLRTDEPKNVTMEISSSSDQLLLATSTGCYLISIQQPGEPECSGASLGKFADGDDRLFLRTMLSNSITMKSSDLVHHVVRDAPKELGDFVLTENNRLVAVALAQEPVIQLYQTNSGALVGECRGHTDWVHSIQARPGHAQFATVGWDNTIRIWNSKSNVDLRRLSVDTRATAKQHSDASTDGSRTLLGTVSNTRTNLLSADGQSLQPLVLSGDVRLVLDSQKSLVVDKDELRLVSTVTGRDEFKLHLGNKRVGEALYIPTHEEIAVLMESGELYGLAIANKEMRPISEASEQISCFLVTPDNTTIIAGTADGKLLSIDTATKQKKVLSRFDSPIVYLDYNEAAQKLLATTFNHQLIWWDLKANESIRKIDCAKFHTIQAKFALDDAHAVTHAFKKSKEVQFWDLQQDQPVSSIKASQVAAIDVTKGLQFVGIATRDDGALVWDATTGQLQQVSALACDGCKQVGNRLVFATRPITARDNRDLTNVPTDDPVLIQWDLSTKTITSKLAVPYYVSEIHSSKDGSVCAIVGECFGVSVFDSNSTRRLGDFLGHPSSLEFAGFLENKAIVVTVARGGTILIHDIEKNTEALVGKHDYAISAVAQSPDRDFLVTSDFSGKTVLWDLKNRTAVREIKVDSGILRQHVIARDSKRAASLLGSNEIQIWDLRSGTPKSHTLVDSVRQIAISPDGTSILAVCGKNEVHASPSRKFDINSTSKSIDIRLIQADSMTEKEVSLDGEIVTANFLPDPLLITALNDRGEIFILDAKSLQTHLKLETSPRCHSLCFANADSKLIFGISQERITGWNWSTGEIQFEMETTNSHPFLRSPIPWSAEIGQSPWWLFRDEMGLVKVPKSPKEYALGISPTN